MAWAERPEYKLTTPNPGPRIPRMSEMQEDTPTDQTSLVLDEFMENLAKLSDGMSEAAAGALRMQMLVLEDAQSMIAGLSSVIEATARPDNSGGDA